MPERVTTSFIPKEALQTPGTPTYAAKQGPFVIINIVATFILVSSILAAGGFYIAVQYTESQRASAEQQLANARAAFEPESIRSLDQLSRRITGAERLLQTHVAPSTILDELAVRTQQQLRFKDFTLARDPLQSSYKVSMSGEALSLNTIALQAKAFSESAIIQDPLFSGVNTIENGNVVFQFTASVPKSRVTYAERVESRQQQGGQVEAPQQQEGMQFQPLQ